MSKCIWKYPFSIDEKISLELPKMHQILDVQDQKGRACLWALVDPDSPREERNFRIVGTGHDLRENESVVYIATFQQMNGMLVWHIFEIL